MLIFCFVFATSAIAQPPKTKVLTLGVFHFNFPNLDRQQIGKADQIDVMGEKYQQEIEVLVNKLYQFKPTIIVIERLPQIQQKMDSLNQQYLTNQFSLKRDEEQQVGFRLAKKWV